MQTVYVVQSPRSYVSHLSGLRDKGINLNVVPLHFAERAFAASVDLEEQATFVVDINAFDIINVFLEIIHRNFPISENVRLIVVSDLETWSNTLPVAYANNITGGFRRRKPIAGALEKYSLENTLYDTGRSGAISLKIVYLGMVYGGKGFDFEKVFLDIWSDKFALPSPPSSSQASNSAVLGHIHYDRLLTLIADMIANPQNYPSLIPLFDYNTCPLVDIFVSCNQKVNPESTPVVAGAATSNSVQYLLEQGKYTANVAAFMSTLQSSKYGFDKDSNLENQWDSIWSEFVAANGLRPVKSLVAGPPKSGKTENAKNIAERLQIKYVDGFSAVQHVLMEVTAPPAPAEATTAAGTTEETPVEPKESEAEALFKLRAALIAAIDAKLAEGAKPSKDKNAAPKTIVNAEGKVDESQINLAVIGAAISADLQRQCIRAFVQRDVLCRRRGFVLDIWEQEGLRAVHEYLQPPGSESIPAVDIIYELKCDDKVMVQQLQDSYGAGFAKNKEGQAAVKALETSLAAYSATLTTYTISLSNAEGDNASNTVDEKTGTEETKVVEETKQVHSVVKAILDANMSPSVVLIQRDLTDTASAGGGLGVPGNVLRAQDVSAEILQVKADALGWCRGDNPPVAAADTTVGDEKTVDVQTADTTVPTTAGVTENSETASEAVAPPAKPVDVNKMKGLQTMNDFLTNTILPVLATGMIQAIRNDVHDPIAFLADYLLAESSERQTRCEEEARANFEDLLKNC